MYVNSSTVYDAQIKLWKNLNLLHCELFHLNHSIFPQKRLFLYVIKSVGLIYDINFIYFIFNMYRPVFLC